MAAGDDADAAQELTALSAARPERALVLLDRASTLDLTRFVADRALAERLRKAAADELDRQVSLDTKGQAQVERVALARRALGRARLLVPRGRWLDELGKLSALARSRDRLVALAARPWTEAIPLDALEGAEIASAKDPNEPPPGDDWARTKRDLDEFSGRTKSHRLEFFLDALLAQPGVAWLWKGAAVEAWDEGQPGEGELAQRVVYGFTQDPEDDMVAAVYAFSARRPGRALATYDDALTHGKKEDSWNRVLKAQALAARGSGQEGLDLMQSVLIDDPGMDGNDSYWFTRAWIAAATDPAEVQRCFAKGRAIRRTRPR